jgi:hypothetical protein
MVGAVFSAVECTIESVSSCAICCLWFLLNLNAK